MMILRIKGGPGSGHVGHSGRPGIRGGSLPGKGGGGAVKTYTDAAGTKIYVVRGGDDLPEELIEAIKSTESGVVRVTYNSATGNWHISSKDVWESDHGDFLNESLEGHKPKYPDSILARGMYDIGKGSLTMYDFSDALKGVAGDNYLEERRLVSQANRSLGRATWSAFKVDGEAPEVDIQPFEKFAGG